MKRKLAGRLLGALLLLPCLLGALLPVQAADAPSAQELIDGILRYEQADAPSVQQWLDTALTKKVGGAAEWFVLALRQSGVDYDFTSYARAVDDYLATRTVSSAATRQKLALTLTAVGHTNAFVQSTMTDSIGQQGVMSLVFGLHLLNNGQKSPDHTTADVTEQLLARRLPDGGWAVTGTASDVDVTAMAVQALAPQYAAQPSVRAAVDEAVVWLSAQQLPDGGYQSFGVCNPESAAQVLTALAALGTDAVADARFIKNGHTLIDGITAFRRADGSFSHTVDGGANETATAQVLVSLTALQRCRRGAGSFFMLDPLPTASTTVPTKTTPTTDAIATAVIETTVAETTVAETTFATSAEVVKTETTAAAITTAVAASDAPRSYKPMACLAVGGAALLACMVLWLLKKRHIFNFIAVGAAALLAILFVLLTNFQSADSYYNGLPADKPDATGVVTLSVRCDVLTGRDEADVPADGVLLPPTTFAIRTGDTVYTVLTEAARQYGLHTENRGQSYIVAIAHLSEGQFGELSGWVYLVNGLSPSVGCGDYVLHDGDTVEWRYTCELGHDVTEGE